MRTWAKIALWTLGLGFFMIFAILPFRFSLVTGDGMHVGYISEVANEGIFWKPTEVTLLNVQTTMSERDTVWHYGIEPSLIDQAKAAQEANSKVKVHYTTKRFTWDWDYFTNVVIDNIEVLDGEE